MSFNPGEIARHFAMLHRLAAGHNGKLVLAAFGEGRAPEISHFDIGANGIAAMTNAALAYQNVPGANLYAPLAVMRGDLPAGMKGGESDVVAVLGAVVDSDGDKGNAAYPPLQADYVVETSPGNFQHFILFDSPLSVADAKPLLQALKRATKADCADDASHVWRVAGTANWPGAAKLKRGRSPEPFLVNVKRHWDGSRTKVADLRKALEIYWEAPQVERATAVAAIGELDPADIAGVVAYLTERDEFAAYEEWLRAGMALKLACGDEGFEIWQSTFDGTVTDAVADAKWRSFGDRLETGSTTLLSLIARARELGWRGSVRKTAAAMFPSVTLPAASNTGPAGGVPMMAGQQRLCELAAPILTDFVANTAARPPRTADYPTLPESMSAHGLYDPLRTAIARVIAMTENGPKLFKHDREVVTEPLAVLQIVHADTFDAIRRRVSAFGCELLDRKIKHAAAALLERVDRTFVSGDWQLDFKGNIENDNPDNVAVFMGVIGCEIRWNAWLERMEIKGGNDPDHLTCRDWTYIDDTIVAKLRTRAMRTKTRFKPGKDFFWESLLALAHLNVVDPVIDRLAELQNQWDGTPRLSTWLPQTCGVADDPYHQAVARNIIGGMVRRARHPGSKHDTTPVLYGREGTAKSSLAAILADMGATSLQGIRTGGARNFTDAVLFGDASKELVLLLAGILVVEVAEMGTRSSANGAHIKAMLTRQTDRGRTAYARAVSERPRRNIFIGTTNENEPLTDTSGNRRFMPICIKTDIDLEWLSANICQLVGEAATLEAAGDDFTIPRDVWSIAAEHADAARSQSDIEILFREWFTETPHTMIAYIMASDLTTLCRMADLRSSNGHRSAIMHSLGFRIERPYIGGKQSAVWYRGPAGLPKAIEREGARYTIGTNGNGRPQVAIRIDRAPSLVPPPMPLAALPPIKAEQE